MMYEIKVMNALTEFLEEIKGKTVISSWIECEYQRDSSLNIMANRERIVYLRLGYTPAEYQNFIDKIDFVYEADYEGDDLYGVIWYADGSWSERHEYDGLNIWHYCKIPEYPPECIDGSI